MQVQVKCQVIWDELKWSLKLLWADRFASPNFCDCVKVSSSGGYSYSACSNKDFASFLWNCQLYSSPLSPASVEACETGCNGICWTALTDSLHRTLLELHLPLTAGLGTLGPLLPALCYACKLRPFAFMIPKTQAHWRNPLHEANAVLSSRCMGQTSVLPYSPLNVGAVKKVNAGGGNVVMEGKTAMILPYLPFCSTWNI